jgi:hypothetical protein
LRAMNTETWDKFSKAMVRLLIISAIAAALFLTFMHVVESISSKPGTLMMSSLAASTIC